MKPFFQFRAKWLDCQNLPRMIGLVTILIAVQTLAADLDPVVVGKWPAFRIESPQDVAVQGDYAYVATAGFNGGLVVVDIRNPANPEVIGHEEASATVGSNNAWAVAVSGNYAYVPGYRYDAATQTDRGRLRVIDISVPAKPRQVASVETSGEAADVAVSGNYAYLVDHYTEPAGQSLRGRLQVIDIANPIKPQLVGTLDIGVSPGAVTLAGSFAYVAGPGADGQVSLLLIDLANPAKPQLVGTFETTNGNYVSSVAISGGFAYLAAWQDQVVIVDIRDPAHPKRVGSLVPDTGATHVVVSGNYAYVGDPKQLPFFNRVDVFDISDPLNPRRLEGIELGTLAGNNMTVSGEYVYVTGFSGVWIIDVRDPANPQLVGRVSSVSVNSFTVSVAGDYAFLTDFGGAPTLIDVTNPAKPRETGGFLYLAEQAQSIAVSGMHAFAASGYSGLQVFNIATPSEPKLVGNYGAGTGGYVQDVAISANYAYLADVKTGFHVVDISNPASPRRVAQIEANASIQTVVLSGDYAYVTDAQLDAVAQTWRGALWVIDVRNPASPRKIGSVDTGSARGALAISGNYAFAAGGDWLGGAGLEVFDISNPVHPQQIGRYSYTTNKYANGVAVAGNYAYLTYEVSGLHVIDISNPANPRRVGGNGSFRAFDVTVVGDKVFVAAGADGLVILNAITPPLRFEPLAHFDAGTFRFSLSGPVGQSARVLRSDNLRDWLDWQTVTLGSGLTELSDSEAGRIAGRFYRAVAP